MVEISIERLDIAYEEYDGVEEFTVSDSSTSRTGTVDIEECLQTDDGKVWDIELMLVFNEPEITVEISDYSNGYEYHKFDGKIQFSNWCKENGASVI